MSYEDFASLRPEYSASSWRGAMLKAQSKGWVQKRAISGRSVFRLTKSGRDRVSADFAAFQMFLKGNKSISLLGLNLSEVMPKSLSTVRGALKEYSGVCVLPGIWALPGSVPEMLIRQIQRVQGKTLVLHTEGDQSLISWQDTRFSVLAQQSYTCLEEASKEIDRLLLILDGEKKLHHTQISQIGGISVSVLTEIQSLSWLVLEDSVMQDRVFLTLQGIDEAFSLWRV